MKKIWRRIICFYRLVNTIGIAFTLWKFLRFWHTGTAQRTGHAIDASISIAAKKLEKSAVALEEWADSGQGETLGKNLDDILMDTKKALETASDLVLSAINRAL
jgi:hypothetical protein